MYLDTEATRGVSFRALNAYSLRSNLTIHMSTKGLTNAIPKLTNNKALSKFLVESTLCLVLPGGVGILKAEQASHD